MDLRVPRSLLLASIVAAVGGCGGADPEALTPVEDQLVLRTTPYMLAPGEEIYLCQVFPANGPARWIDRVDLDRVEGLHHVFVSIVPGAEDPEALARCTDVTRLREQALLPVVAPGRSFTMPDGVAIALHADDGLEVQLHLLNTTAKPLDVAVTWRAHTVPESRVEQPAGMFQFSMPDLDLPPHQETTVSRTCAAPADVLLFSANGHFHEHEVAFKASIAGVPILDGAGTDGGARVTFDPARAVHAGDPISWSCTDVNTGADDVHAGPSFVKNEMCNFSAYVYPVPGSTTFRCR